MPIFQTFPGFLWTATWMAQNSEIDDDWSGQIVTDAAFAHVTTGGGEDIVVSVREHAAVSTGGGDDAIVSFGRGARLDGGSGDDTIVAAGNTATVLGGRGDDRVLVAGTGSTVDAGRGDDLVRALRSDTLVNGGRGDDVLIGGRGTDSLWGGAGDDAIRGGLGADYALGGAGNDMTDTGQGLGIHFGGAGHDVFRIGADIAGNGAVDTIVALDFTPGVDRLRIAQSVLDQVASVVEGSVNVTPVLQAFEAAGLSVEEAGMRLALTEGGTALFAEVAAVLATLTDDGAGGRFAPATTVTTNEGDVIIALGITSDQLLAAIA